MDVRTNVGELLDRLADRLGITPWSVIVGGLGIVAAGIGGWWALAPPAPPPAEDVLPRVAAVAAPATSGVVDVSPTVLVHVDGAVMRPGVHELEGDHRVLDAVDAAGGLRPDADRARLNLAARVVDGQRVWVPVVGEDEPDVVAPTGGAASNAEGGSGPVDLNAADATELETLPGVGPSIAAAIIQHREREGSFERIDDLLEVAGIGPTRLAQLEPLVAV
ncbi:MAG: helix-hairpin-helix domain-containing protein [Actinomycetota bacterium]